jgi:hypothetical protein
VSTPEFPQAAYNQLIQQVYAPVFFTKLAQDYGFPPRSEAERQALLELAGVLQQAEVEEHTKSADVHGSPYVAALDELKGVLNQTMSRTVPTSQDRLIKQAAHDLAGDDNLASAALAWGAYVVQSQQG